MYPRNAASPEPIAIGPVVQISDGAVQTSGVTVRVKPIGVAEADGGGTTAYSTDGVVLYTPTQAETNYTSFVLIAKKTGCIPASVTVVTSASNTTGYAGTDHSKIANPTSTVNLSGTTIKNATDNASQTSVDTLASYVDTEVAAIKAKTDNLPAQPAAVSDIPTANQNRDAVMNAMPNGGWTAGSFGDRWIISNNSNRTIGVTGSGSGHVQCDVHALQPEVINSAAIAAGALNGKGDWLTTLGANAPANWINAAAIATDAIDSDAIADSAKTEIANAVAALQVLSRLDSMIESDGAGQFRFDTIAVSLASQGGGGGAVNISVEDQSITVC